MLDRFTDRARKVMSMAKQEALDLHSNKVGTEHLLLALAKEDEGIAAEALRSLDISYDDIMDTLKEVQTTVPEPSEETEAAKLAFTPLVISVMERSFRVARENNQTYVSTEHLLIGIVEEGNGMAMDILMRLGVSSASIKKAIEKLTAKDQDKKRPLAGAGAGQCEHVRVHGDGVKQALGTLVKVFKDLLAKAALLRCFLQQLLIVKRNTQLLGDTDSHLFAAAAELPADANDQMLLHKSTASP